VNPMRSSKPERISSNLPQKRTAPPSSAPLADTRNTYLHVGDKVFHKNFKAWGYGIVVEARSSQVPGGSCYARILFQDGKGRVFDNSFSSATCCYHTGITLIDSVEI
jgi:hypothetical protein